MVFTSTRDKNSTKYTSAQVIKQGLANDGGLFLPTEIPKLNKEDFLSFASLSYPELAATILAKFLTDYSYAEILEDCENAYSNKSFGTDLHVHLKIWLFKLCLSCFHVL